MSVAIIGVAGTVAAAGVGAYSSYASNKAADARQKAALAAQGGSGAKGFTPFTPPPMPAYVPQNITDIKKQALKSDTTGFATSDADFAKRHPELLGAEKAFELQTEKDQTGNTELMPQLQSEYMRSGLGNALGAFGDTGPTLAPGSSGEADVARNLGMDIQGFQQQNRQNREQSLGLAEGLFPRRQFGLTGEDTANLLTTNNLGQNNFNQANYAVQAGVAQTNYLAQAQNANAQTAQANVNAQAAATRQAASQQAISGIAQAALSGLSTTAGRYYGAGSGVSSIPNVAYQPNPVAQSNLSYVPPGFSG